MAVHNLLGDTNGTYPDSHFKTKLMELNYVTYGITVKVEKRTYKQRRSYLEEAQVQTSTYEKTMLGQKVV